MKHYQVVMTLLLNDDANTDWIERAIEENLEQGEEILEGNISEQGTHEVVKASNPIDLWGDYTGERE